jgi:hypothetical protein
MAGEMDGIYLGENSHINYRGEVLFFFSHAFLPSQFAVVDRIPAKQQPRRRSGIAPKQMMGRFRGEAIYSAEVDVHFPQLTVGDTLAFAAEARAVSVFPLFPLPLSSSFLFRAGWDPALSKSLTLFA